MTLQIKPKYFGIILLMLAACEDNPDTQDCFVKTSSITFENGSKEITTFLYDDNLRIIELTENATYPGGATTTTLTFQYDAIGNIAEVNFNDGNRVVNLFNANNQRIKRETYINGLLQSSREYEYNASGQLIQFTSYNSLGTMTGYELYEYPSTATKNFSQNKIYSHSNTLTGTNDYEYDTKRPSWPDLGLGTYTDNNPISIIYKEADGSVGTTFSKVYEYSSLGYPSQVTTTVTSGFSNTVGIEILKYNCR